MSTQEDPEPKEAEEQSQEEPKLSDAEDQAQTPPKRAESEESVQFLKETPGPKPTNRRRAIAQEEKDSDEPYLPPPGQLPVTIYSLHQAAVTLQAILKFLDVLANEERATRIFLAEQRDQIAWLNGLLDDTTSRGAKRQREESSGNDGET